MPGNLGFRLLGVSGQSTEMLGPEGVPELLSHNLLACRLSPIRRRPHRDADFGVPVPGHAPLVYVGAAQNHETIVDDH
jgi:hypothetical protein